jgi:hypothetical protein
LIDNGTELDALAKLPAAEQRSLAEAAKRGAKVSAITAHSACDPEDSKTSDTEEIELGKVIARLRRERPRNPDTMRVCDALERRLLRTKSNEVMEIQMSNPNCDKVSKQPTKPRKKNALAHGIYSKDILLPWESRKEFNKLLADLRDEFRPEGRMENEIVFDLAHSRWQKYRVHQMYIAAAYDDPFVSGLVEARQKSWAGMRNHLRWKSINERTISEMINELFLEQVEESAKTLVKAVREGKLVNSEIAQGKAFLDVSKNFTAPLIEALEAQPSVGDSLRRTYSPEDLEPIIRLEAMIDARIDKALARLVSLKEYKRMAATYSPPLIPVDASTPSSNQGEVENRATVIEGIFSK